MVMVCALQCWRRAAADGWWLVRGRRRRLELREQGEQEEGRKTAERTRVDRASKEGQPASAMDGSMALASFPCFSARPPSFVLLRP